MFLAYLIIFGSTLAMAISAVIALGWAAREGQFQNMTRGAEVIFDADEHVGKPTDLIFPVKQTKQQKKATSAR